MQMQAISDWETAMNNSMESIHQVCEFPTQCVEKKANSLLVIIKKRTENNIQHHNDTRGGEILKGKHMR